MTAPHCVCCLNLDGKLVPATSEMRGYQVCESHVGLLSETSENLLQLFGRLKRQPTRRAT